MFPNMSFRQGLNFIDKIFAFDKDNKMEKSKWVVAFEEGNTIEIAANHMWETLTSIIPINFGENRYLICKRECGNGTVSEILPDDNEYLRIKEKPVKKNKFVEAFEQGNKVFYDGFLVTSLKVLQGYVPETLLVTYLIKDSQGKDIESYTSTSGCVKHLKIEKEKKVVWNIFYKIQNKIEVSVEKCESFNSEREALIAYNELLILNPMTDYFVAKVEWEE